MCDGRMKNNGLFTTDKEAKEYRDFLIKQGVNARVDKIEIYKVSTITPTQAKIRTGGMYANRELPEWLK